MHPTETGRLIGELRREAGLTQQELAARLHVTGAAVSKWERGLCYPDIELVAKMAELFSVHAGDILSGRRQDEDTGAEADALALESVRAYTGSVRRQMGRRMAVLALVLVLLALAGGVLLAWRLLPPSGFSRVSGEYGLLYHSDTADVCQLLTQYALNGERRTLVLYLLVEKEDGAVTDVHKIQLRELGAGESAFQYSAFCIPDAPEPGAFQIVLTLSAQERDKGRRTIATEAYTVRYDPRGQRYTMEA